MWYLFYLYSFILSLVLSLILTKTAIFISNKWHIYDEPGERKIHVSSMPLLGWMGIFGGLIITISINALILYLLGANPDFLRIVGKEISGYIPGIYKKFPTLIGLLAGGAYITLLGLYDDRVGLSPLKKFIGQIIAGIILVLFDVRITFFIPNYALSAILTIGWVVIVINSFNLLDNMDGLSGGIALIASLIFFFAVAAFKQYFISSMLVILAGSILGFLFFNFSPAKIFMGDAGSMFLGYMISSLTILGTFYCKGLPTHFSVIMPLIVLAVPIYDTLSVIIIRVKNKRPIYVGDNNHFSHRLVNLGMSKKGAVYFIYLVSFCAGISSLLLPYVNLTGALMILAQTFSVLSVIAFLEYYGRIKTN